MATQAGDLRALAPSSLVLEKVEKTAAVDGYAHATTTGKGRALGLEDNAVTWTFRASRDDGSKHARLPEWLEELLSRENPSCGLCSKVFTTNIDLENHLLGKPHLRRVREQQRRKRSRDKADQAAERRAKRQDASQTPKAWFFCDACKLDVNSQADLDTHLLGKRHKANVSKAAALRVGPPGAGQ